MTAEAEIGKIYRGKVVTIKEFGAFVEFLPGKDGLVHISELANFRVKKTEDIVQDRRRHHRQMPRRGRKRPRAPLAQGRDGRPRQGNGRGQKEEPAPAPAQ